MKHGYLGVFVVYWNEFTERRLILQEELLEVEKELFRFSSDHIPARRIIVFDHHKSIPSYHGAIVEAKSTMKMEDGSYLLMDEFYIWKPSRVLKCS